MLAGDDWVSVPRPVSDERPARGAGTGSRVQPEKINLGPSVVVSVGDGSAVYVSNLHRDPQIAAPHSFLALPDQPLLMDRRGMIWVRSGQPDSGFDLWQKGQRIGHGEGVQRQLWCSTKGYLAALSHEFDNELKSRWFVHVVSLSEAAE